MRLLLVADRVATLAGAQPPQFVLHFPRRPSMDGLQVVRGTVDDGILAGPAQPFQMDNGTGGLLPVVSYLGPATAGILTGSLVIERIFFIPGTGSHFINSATNRDYTLAMGVTILYTVLVYALNTVVDLAYTFLDPRIELEES